MTRLLGGVARLVGNRLVEGGSPAYWGHAVEHGLGGGGRPELEESCLAWARAEFEDLEQFISHRGSMRCSEGGKDSDGFTLDWARKISRV